MERRPKGRRFVYGGMFTFSGVCGSIDRKSEVDTMLDKLKQIEEKYVEIEARMAQPEVYTVPAAYAKCAREQKELQPVVEAYRKYMQYRSDMDDALEMMSDPEMKEFAQDEFETAKAAAENMEGEL